MTNTNEGAVLPSRLILDSSHACCSADKPAGTSGAAWPAGVMGRAGVLMEAETVLPV